ncbi:MAG: hypothetical protein ACR2OO_12335 [Thermomicrobiales bacterium]
MVQIDMLSGGTGGSKLVASESARLMRSLSPDVGDGVACAAAARTNGRAAIIPATAAAPPPNAPICSNRRRDERHSAHCLAARSLSWGTACVAIAPGIESAIASTPLDTCKRPSR